MSRAAFRHTEEYTRMITPIILAAVLLFSLLFAGRAAALPTLVLLFAMPGGLSSGDCDDWSVACELQYALGIATPSPDFAFRIRLQEGTYKPTSGGDRTISFVMRNTVSIFGGYASTPDHTRDPATHVSILSGDLSGDDGVHFANNSDNGLHVVDASGTNNTAVLDGVTITAGNGNGGFGGGVGGGLFDLGGSPRLNNVGIERNHALQGGGMYNTGGATLTDVVFYANEALVGGGLVCIGSAASLSDVTFIANHTFGDGGGLWSSNGCSTLTKASFSLNYANGNGGGYYDTWSSSINLANVTFYYNAAAGDGGGMYNNEAVLLSLTNVTFNQNSADHGGAIYNVSPGTGGGSSTPILTNVILWDDYGEFADNEISNLGAWPSIDHSVVEGGCASISDAVCGSGNLDTNPNLGPRANNGGLTDTLALGAGSSALDSGLEIGWLTSDQRGISRPQDGNGDGSAATDIGAVSSERSFTISGNAGVPDVLMSYTGGSTTSDGSGEYAFSVPEQWSGTATPSKISCTFTPRASHTTRL